MYCTTLNTRCISSVSGSLPRRKRGWSRGQVLWLWKNNRGWRKNWLDMLIGSAELVSFAFLLSLRSLTCKKFLTCLFWHRNSVTTKHCHNKTISHKTLSQPNNVTTKLCHNQIMAKSINATSNSQTLSKPNIVTAKHCIKQNISTQQGQIVFTLFSGFD